MPPFRFKLQTLERLREAARDAARAQLAEALRVDEVLQEKQAELDGHLQTARDLQVVRAGAVDVDRLLQAQRFEAAVAAEMQHVLAQRAQVAQEISKRRDVLVEADREVKVLEKLKAVRKAEHERAERQAEMKLFDEAAGRRRPEEVDAWAS